MKKKNSVGQDIFQRRLADKIIDSADIVYVWHDMTELCHDNIPGLDRKE